MERLFGVFKIGNASERRDRALEGMVQKVQPDCIFFVDSWKFDIARLKSYYRGQIAFYDFDGPRRKSITDFLALRGVDRLFTVSDYLVKELKSYNMDSIYLPHGVDADYYSPGNVVSALVSPVSYIGRATERRSEWCRLAKPYGLKLYGKRWRKNEYCRNAELVSCIGLDRDIDGREVVDVYRSSGAVLNILQEPLDEYRTILSIQCFAIPATAACLIAENVEELPLAFEPGREVLSFQSPDELVALLEKCAAEPKFVHSIGENGRRRCLAEHLWKYRVDDFLKAW